MMGKYALLIANSKYNDARLNSLSAPSEDVVALKAVLDDPLIGGFDSAEPVNNSSLEQVQRDLKQFLKNRSPEDLILIYFTGHGLLDSDGNLWLALAGSDAEYADVGSLEAEYLRKAMDKCASRRQVLVLDCCHSGAIEKEILDGIIRAKDGITRPAVIRDTFDPEQYGRYVLASSSATQRSYEIGAKSVFTRAMVEGLRSGSAAPEKDLISLRDVANHIRESLKNLEVAMNPFIAPDNHEFDKLIIAKNPRPRHPIPDRLLAALNDPSSHFARLGAIEQLKELALGKKSEFYRAQAIDLFTQRLVDEEHVKVHDALKKAVISLQLDVGDEVERRPGSNGVASPKRNSETWTARPTTFPARVDAAKMIAMLVLLTVVSAVAYLIWIKQKSPWGEAMETPPQGTLVFIEEQSSDKRRTKLRIADTGCVSATNTVSDLVLSIPVIAGGTFELPRSLDYTGCKTITIRGQSGEFSATGKIGEKVRWQGKCILVNVAGDRRVNPVAILSTCST